MYQEENKSILTHIENMNKLTENVIQKLKILKYKVATMESCTAGMVATTLTNVSGSSEVLKESFVTYSNEAKIRQGVPASVIQEYGVYSRQTAQSMAEALLLRNDIGIGVTGTLGNIDPANTDSTIGDVYFCIEDTSGKCILKSIKVDVTSITSREAQKKEVTITLLESLNTFLDELLASKGIQSF